MNHASPVDFALFDLYPFHSLLYQTLQLRNTLTRFLTQSQSKDSTLIIIDSR